MGLDIFFLDDIRNSLLAANEASAATAAVITEVGGGCGHPFPRTAAITCSVCKRKEYYVAASDFLPVSLRVYREGYVAALKTVALAFGISLATLWREVRLPGL